ncbi:MAG: type II secretion system protein [Verrucomicrobiota bacterium]
MSNMRKNPNQNAFSLIELLAAITVLAVLGAIVSQMIGATNQAIRISTSKIDATSQARLAFSRIERDILQILKRDDADALFTNATSPTSGDEVLKFFSAVTSEDRAVASPNRGMSLVGYLVGGHTNTGGKLCLQRGAVAIHYSDVGFMGLTNSGSPILFTDALSSVPNLNPVGNDYDVLAEGVFRVWISFQLNPQEADGSGNISVGQIHTTSSPSDRAANGNVYVNPPVRRPSTTGSYFVNFDALSSIVVGLVAIDLESKKLLSTTQLDSVATAFGNLSDGQLPVEQWGPIADNSSNFTGIPLAATKSIRVYQRSFPITPAWASNSQL